MRAPKNLHFSLELANAPARPDELLRLHGRHTGNLTSVDAVLLDPVVDGVTCAGDRLPTGGLHAEWLAFRKPRCGAALVRQRYSQLHRSLRNPKFHPTDEFDATGRIRSYACLF